MSNELALWLAVGAGVLAVLYGLVSTRWILSQSAGNERTSGFYYHLKPVSFPSDKINITPQFLANKIVPDFQQFFPEIDDPLELFLKVNRDLRKENIAKVFAVGQQSASQPLWTGVFLRQPNSAVPG